MGVWTALSLVDVESIGAGGGSIAWIDARGMLRVGPRSAGADPGPACYGRGGHEATVTDALVVLGYVDPTRFLGGDMALDADAATDACARLGERTRTRPAAKSRGASASSRSPGWSRPCGPGSRRAASTRATHALFSYGGCGALFTPSIAAATRFATGRSSRSSRRSCRRSAPRRPTCGANALSRALPVPRRSAPRSRRRSPSSAKAFSTIWPPTASPERRPPRRLRGRPALQATGAGRSPSRSRTRAVDDAAVTALVDAFRDRVRAQRYGRGSDRARRAHRARQPPRRSEPDGRSRRASTRSTCPTWRPVLRRHPVAATSRSGSTGDPRGAKMVDVYDGARPALPDRSFAARSLVDGTDTTVWIPDADLDSRQPTTRNAHRGGRGRE